MARPLRLEFAGALYHVTARGDRGKWGQSENHARISNNKSTHADTGMCTRRVTTHSKTPFQGFSTSSLGPLV